MSNWKGETLSSNRRNHAYVDDSGTRCVSNSLAKPRSALQPGEKKSPLVSEGAFDQADQLGGLFHIRVRRRWNGIRQVVIVGLHRDDLRRCLGPRRLLLRNSRHSQNNPAVDRIDLENPEIEVHRLVDYIRRTVHRLPKVELAHWNEAFDVVADIDDDALV